MHKFLYTIGALLVLVVTLASYRPVAAQSSGWSQPAEVSDSSRTRSSWFPDIAIAPDNSVHIIWGSGIKPDATKEELDLLMYREFRDGAWGEINDIDNPGTGGRTVRNSIVLARDGRLHVLVRRGYITYHTSAPYEAAWSAQAWSTPRAINGNSSYFNAIASDSQGRLHALWSEAISDDPKAPKPVCSFCSDLFYRYSDDGGNSWSEPTNLSQSLQGSVKPQIKIDKDDHVHVAWEEGFDWYATSGTPTAAMYRRSLDRGATWQPGVRITLPIVQLPAPTPFPGSPPPPTPAPIQDAPQQITLGLYQQSIPIVVYRSTALDTIYYQRSPDGGATWTEAQPLPGVKARILGDTPVDGYTMATDSLGNVHFIFTGLRSNENSELAVPSLMHMSWNGERWSQADIIAASANYPGWSSELAPVCAPSQDPKPRDPVKLEGCQKQTRYPEYPRAVMSDGNQLHVVWFTRNRYDLYISERAGYKVWYAVRQLDAPAVAPLPLFTPVPTIAQPTATARPEPSAVPTLAPQPTLAPSAVAADPIAERPAWEGPGLGLVGAAAIPVGIFLAVVVAVGMYLVRRR